MYIEYTSLHLRAFSAKRPAESVVTPGISYVKLESPPQCVEC
jgi:hypothetical protein